MHQSPMRAEAHPPPPAMQPQRQLSNKTIPRIAVTQTGIRDVVSAPFLPIIQGALLTSSPPCPVGTLLFLLGCGYSLFCSVTTGIGRVTSDPHGVTSKTRPITARMSQVTNRGKSKMPKRVALKRRAAFKTRHSQEAGYPILSYKIGGPLAYPAFSRHSP